MVMVMVMVMTISDDDITIFVPVICSQELSSHVLSAASDPSRPPLGILKTIRLHTMH